MDESTESREYPVAPAEGGAPAPRAFAPDLAAYAAEEEEAAVDWRRYLAAVVRQKWLVLGLVVFGTAAAGLVAHYLPEEYEAQSTVWIENQDQRNPGPIRSNELLQANAWIELLRSFVVLDHVVRTERLFIEPAQPADTTLFRDFELASRFRPGAYRLEVSGGRMSLVTGEGMVADTATLGGSIGAPVGFEWRPPAHLLGGRDALRFEVRVPREVAIELGQKLRTRIDQNGNFLRVELRMRTAEEAAGILNAITDRYVEIAGDLKRSRLDELTGILQEQLTYAETNLREAERELESFRVSTITLPSDRSTPLAPGLEITRDPVFDHYFELKLEVDQLRQDRESIERALTGGARGGVAVEALEVIPSVQQSSELAAALAELAEMRASMRALLHRYTEEHPPVQQLATAIGTAEQRTIPRLARDVVDRLSARERVVTAMIDSASTQLEEIPPRSIEEARLRRRVDIAESLFTGLQASYEETRLSAASTIPDIRVLDAAMIPSTPVQERKPMVVLLGFAGSLGLGLLLAILRDRIDPTIRYPNQVTEGMGLSVLGAIPDLIRDRGKFADDGINELTEAFRSIRLNLVHAHGAGPVVLTISSPGAADGKSFIASNLAVSFSDLGKRTLLIDGDIRKGSQHRLMGRKRMPGLTDVLGGRSTLEEALQPTEFAGLDVIPCGQRSGSGPELIGSPRMREIMMELRPRYDVIIVDSAPLAAGVDPFMLGTLTGSMMLVLRTGSTDRDLAEAKLDLLHRLPVRMLGCVLNGVGRNEPGYQYYRYYSYLPGYVAVDEADAPELQEA